MEEIQENLTEKEEKKPKKFDWVFTIIISLIICVLLVFSYLNFFVYINLEVVGPSMESTLFDGDMVFVNKKDTDVERGDIVIIDNVKDYWLIKRVIAVGKCTVEIMPDGFVYVDGEKVEEPYLNGTLTTPLNYGDLGYECWELEEDEIFYLGDNRILSADGRANGPCKKTDIVGTVSNWSVEHKDGFGKFIKKIKSIFGNIKVGDSV